MSLLELAPGKYEIESSENFDEYMKAVGVGLAQRLLGSQLKPSVEIVINGDLWTMTTSAALSKVVISFRVDEEFEETTADGRKVKTVVTIEGNKLVQTQKGVVDSVLVREFTKDGFSLTLKAKDAVASRQYKRVK